MRTRKQKAKASTQGQQQPYDNLLKSLLEDQEAQVLPHFLEEAVYLETLNLEVMRTLLRVDRVYKVLYKGKVHILHLEFETGADSAMASRLLDYHAYLYHKYGLPVISIIVYPFRTQMVTSPLEEMSGDVSILIFYFRVFPLWILSAKNYVQKHAVAMYALLPAMEGANAQLLSQAINEMVEYYKDNEIALARELRWMGIVLRRADIVPLEEKNEIEERLSMYDDLMEKDPKMRKIQAESEVRGETKMLRKVILSVVKRRFPSLLAIAQQRVQSLTRPDDLDIMFEQIEAASDEATVRRIFTPSFE
ncbi:MAG: hypothetical protein H0V70_08915 [Ktedonobacteraceae bacterium]|nr:hypothetical protein [Ktedonobacteraceae bacterium]